MIHSDLDLAIALITCVKTPGGTQKSAGAEDCMMHTFCAPRSDSRMRIPGRAQQSAGSTTGVDRAVTAADCSLEKCARLVHGRHHEWLESLLQGHLRLNNSSRHYSSSRHDWQQHSRQLQPANNSYSW